MDDHHKTVLQGIHCIDYIAEPGSGQHGKNNSDCSHSSKEKEVSTAFNGVTME